MAPGPARPLTSVSARAAWMFCGIAVTDPGVSCIQKMEKVAPPSTTSVVTSTSTGRRIDPARDPGPETRRDVASRHQSPYDDRSHASATEQRQKRWLETERAGEREDRHHQPGRAQ